MGIISGGVICGLESQKSEKGEELVINIIIFFLFAIRRGSDLIDDSEMETKQEETSSNHMKGTIIEKEKGKIRHKMHR